jgi:hypothetical protein
MIEQTLYWLIPLALIALMLWSLVHERSRQRKRTPEEFERDLANTRSSMLRAGMLELDRFAGDARQKRAAVEYLKDEQQGMTKTGGKDDDADRTADKQ